MWMKQVNLSELTEFNATWEAFDATVEHLGRRDQTNLNKCTGRKGHGKSSLIELAPGEKVKIGVFEHVKVWGNHGVLCYWTIKAPPGYFIEYHVSVYEVRAPNIYDCAYEGMMMWDGYHNITGAKRIGPLCYTEPDGLFKSNRGVNNITSSGDLMTIFYYSYMLYNPVPPKRPMFIATVKATPCRGIWQPCSHPVSLSNEHFNLTVKESTGRHGPKTDQVFSCDKAKCCIIQQYPIYTTQEHKECDIHVKTHGDHILATSDIFTQIVVPKKDNQTFEYACERKERLAGLNIGPHRELCKGTQSFLTYTTTSLWSMGAFTIRIQPSPCGFFDPDLHTGNTFYPPCAEAHIPVSENDTTMEYIDYDYTPVRYYTFRLVYENYAQCGANNDTCGHVKILIKGKNTYYGWNNVPPQPFTWRTWGSDDNDTVWRRQVQVSMRHKSLL